MRGKKAAPKRTLLPDARYGSVLVAKLINVLMKDGQKATARKAIYGALARVEQELKQPAVTVLEQAMKHASPLVEVRAKRVGGATYQVPMEVRPERKQALALRWIITSARSIKAQPIDQKLAGEILAAAKNEGNAIKKRDEMHRMAEANKAFAHYARF